MDTVVDLITRYDRAVDLLPYHLRGPARLIDEMDKARVEEFRLRIGRRPTLLLPEGEREFAEPAVTGKELNAVLEVASAASAHAVRDSLKNGYITARGGYRVGLCGLATVRDGEVSGFQNLSSASIRITKAVPGVADGVLPRITAGAGERLLSTLILSPPGGGKTTVLRDIIRQCSDRGHRIAVADERGEIAALRDGEPQLDVGRYTDVLGGCRKDDGVMMLLRAMNPQIVAMDEITAPGDTQALESAANCGVTLLATAHGAGLDDLMRKPMYRRMIRKNLFSRLVVIGRDEHRERVYAVTELEEGVCSG